METILSALIDLIDRYYHQKNINKKLLNLKIKNAIDIGAHKGEFLSSIISIKKHIKVYSFEPQFNIYKNLKIKFKNFKNISVYNLALSNSNKKKKLNINIKSSTSTFSTYDKNSYWKKLKDFLLTGSKNSTFIGYEIVNSITLDKFFKKKKIKNLDLLKIDAEGHEAEILEGAKNILKKKVKYILIEIHFSKIYKNYNKKKIEKILKNNNFILIKKFKFPFLTFEDRIYKKIS